MLLMLLALGSESPRCQVAENYTAGVFQEHEQFEPPAEEDLLVDGLLNSYIRLHRIIMSALECNGNNFLLKCDWRDCLANGINAVRSRLL